MTRDSCAVPWEQLPLQRVPPRRWREAGGRLAAFYLLPSGWHYVLECFGPPPNPGVWFSGARAYGPFPSAYEASAHLASVPGGYPAFVVAAPPPGAEIDPQIMALLSAATKDDPR